MCATKLLSNYIIYLSNLGQIGDSIVEIEQTSVLATCSNLHVI